MLLTLLVTLMLVLQAPGSTLQPDPPMRCAACDAWNEPLPPFKVFGNTYFVGTGGLSSVLITSDSGHILLDGGLTQSAALIDANIRQLGFDPADIRLIAASHEHYDHVGGIATLQRLSGAEVVHSEAGARALRRGLPNDDDPQIAFGREANAFPAVSSVRAVADTPEEAVARRDAVVRSAQTIVDRQGLGAAFRTVIVDEKAPESTLEITTTIVRIVLIATIVEILVVISLSARLRREERRQGGFV